MRNVALSWGQVSATNAMIAMQDDNTQELRTQQVRVMLTKTEKEALRERAYTERTTMNDLIRARVFSELKTAA